MIAWLTDTFIYTALLIAAVLLLRRPVAQNFGPQIAYALWALPLLRLAMPPLVLPASFAPEQAAEVPATTMSVPVDAALVAAAPMAPVAEPGLPWIALAFAAWVAGALLFLGWRYWSYFAMRRDLLAGSRPVGEAGDVRLVETPAVDAPVAFGVIDKVVALPMEFMALEDRAARDLAIEHELAHHRGRDLLANLLAQPLLALHWFNPLAWIGWRAMRRDQEAACDARVIARRGPAERAHYGQVIASFAAGPRLGLAAPMACPMASIWGEKSIIHRLRSLNMLDISPRRRIAGRVLWVGAALALPLTASVSYAVAPPPPAPPAPVAPAAPPAPPAPALPPEADGPHTFVWRSHGDGTKGKKDVTVIVRDVNPGEPVARDENGNPVVRTFTFQHPQPMTREQRRQFEQQRAQARKQWAEQRKQWAKQHKQWSEQDWDKWSEQFGQQFGEEWARKWQDNARQWQEQAQKWQNEWQKNGAFNFAFAGPDVRIDCDHAIATPAPPATPGGRPGRRSIVICNNGANNTAREALERAKASIASDQGLSEETRDEVIDSLDRELERLDRDSDTRD